MRELVHPLQPMDPMNESKDQCDRCGEPVTDEPSLILIESGPLHAERPRLNICGKCGESFQRWVDRRKEGSSRKSRKSKSSRSSSKGSGETSTRDPNEQKKLQDKVRGLIALSVGLAVALVIVLVVWVLSM